MTTFLLNTEIRFGPTALNELAEFAGYLKSGERPYPFSHTAELMRLVIGGIDSREKGGAEVLLGEG